MTGEDCRYSCWVSESEQLAHELQFTHRKLKFSDSRAVCRRQSLQSWDVSVKEEFAVDAGEFEDVFCLRCVRRCTRSGQHLQHSRSRSRVRLLRIRATERGMFPWVLQ